MTVEKIKSYELALAKVSDRALVIGLKRCVEECKFFPTAEEIRERCVLPKEALDEAEARFTDRILAQPKPKLLPSILDSDVQRQLAGAIPRHRRIALGIEQPAEINLPARIEELQRQAAMLGAKNPLHEAAGIGMGLL